MVRPRTLRKMMALCLVLIGFLIGLSISTVTGLEQSTAEAPESNLLTGMAMTLSGPPERASPADRIPESDIKVLASRVIIDVRDAVWATFTDTDSMDPVLDQGANAIQIVPKSMDEIQEGDIISYESEYADGTIIHRVVYKGEDEQGAYVIAKGDNLPTSDPGRIRFEQIKRVLIAIIY